MTHGAWLVLLMSHNNVLEMQWNGSVIKPRIKCQYILFYTTLAIEFVFRHRFSAVLVMEIMQT